MQQEKTPKVSVCVVTYNQEKYIRQCLQSIVDQETDFDFDVLVSDDCSTDDTPAVVKEFAERYPGVVKPIFHEKNIGAYKNFVLVHQQAAGEYVAHMDGDDYALPGKLQAQADLLDSDPSCNIVFHRMLVEESTGETREGTLRNVHNIGEMRFDRGALIQFMAIGAHSSKMYRKTARDYFVPDFGVIDYFANVEQIRDGVARFTGYQNYGVYRAGIGVASDGSKTRQILAACFEYFYDKYPEYRLEVNTAALTYLVADLKNRRKSWPMFLSVWARTFQVGSVVNLLRSLKFIRELRVKK